MKFIKWLFGFKNKYQKQDLAYSRNGIAVRLFTILFLAIMSAGALAMEYYSIYLYDYNIAVGILGTVVVISLIPTVAQYNIMYTVIGFRHALLNTIDDAVSKKIEKDLVKQQMQDINSGERVQPEIFIGENRPKGKKAYKWIDLLVAIFGLLLAVGVIVGAFLVVAIKLHKI